LTRINNQRTSWRSGKVQSSQRLLYHCNMLRHVQSARTSDPSHRLISLGVLVNNNPRNPYAAMTAAGSLPLVYFLRRSLAWSSPREHVALEVGRRIILGQPSPSAVCLCFVLPHEQLLASHARTPAIDRRRYLAVARHACTGAQRGCFWRTAVLDRPSRPDARSTACAPDPSASTATTRAGAVRAVPISGEDKSRRVLGTMVDGWTGTAVQASASREKLCTNRNARLTAKKPFPVWSLKVHCHSAS
jgi:hypothetical protein